jgi:hypothetical protein
VEGVFIGLEHNDGLNPSLPPHIWLLHYLFHASIDEDAQQWAAAWNSHCMQLRGERSRSPEDMFMAGILQQGARGLNLRPQANMNEAVNDTNQYGVDWSVHSDRRLMRHLHEHNPDDNNVVESFCLPKHMARVECKPPHCPFTPDEMLYLRSELIDRVANHVHRRDMPSRRIVWCHAFAIASEIQDPCLQHGQ